MCNGFKIIALCITRAFEERGSDFIETLNSALTDMGYRLFVYHSCSDFYWGKPNEQSDKTVFKLMDYSIIDGIVIFGEKFYDEALIEDICGKAHDHGTPVVLIGSRREDCICVNFGYEKGFEQVVRHVVEDHRITDIFFVAGVKGNDFSDRRIEMFKMILEENGLTFDPERVGYGDFWWMPTENIVNELFENKKLPKAFICANDSMAITVCNFLQKRGIRIPEDIIITGFDGITEAMYNMPPITTCGTDKWDISNVIADVFHKYFNGEKVEKQYTVEFELKIYSSCGCESRQPYINKGELLKSADERFMYYQGDEQIFYDMSESIMLCSDPKDIVTEICKVRLSDFAVFVNSSCFDDSINPAAITEFGGFDDEMTMLVGDAYDKLAYPCKFERKNILPKLDSVLEKKRPIVFNTLGFMGISYGYLCLYMETGFNTYCRIQQYVSALNYSLGSYRNVNYVRYVAKNIEYIADHDYMTGLLNRSGFYKKIDGLAKAAKSNEVMTVTLIDMDGLKYINDTFGHSCGDFAIKTISQAAEAVDTESKISGRFGGDEFVICTFSADPENEKANIRRSINQYLANINSTSNQPFEVSASIGTAVGTGEGEDFDDLFRLADEEMYKEKITRPHHRRRQA